MGGRGSKYFTSLFHEDFAGPSLAGKGKSTLRHGKEEQSIYNRLDLSRDRFTDVQYHQNNCSRFTIQRHSINL
eukprot:scaffold1208_cov145-Skeletonema_marinoi.AAC.2